MESASQKTDCRHSGLQFTHDGDSQISNKIRSVSNGESTSVVNSIEFDVSSDKNRGSSSVNILSLPPELLVRILEFVPARHAILFVSLVCRQFWLLLSSHSWWKLRYGALCGSRRDDVVSDVSAFDCRQSCGWRNACVEREDAINLWGSTEVMENSCYHLLGHYAPIDCVKLLSGKGKQLCLSGSRDRSVNVWDLDLISRNENFKGNNQAVIATCAGHKGWVWCFASHWPETNVVCSGGWDSQARLWSLTDSNLTLLRDIRHSNIVLSLNMPEPNVLISGSADNETRHYDLRGSGCLTRTVRSHRMPVLCLQTTDKFVISGSSDKTIAIWDRRADCEYKKIQVPFTVLSLHYGYGLLRAGCSDGSVYTFVRDDFQLVELDFNGSCLVAAGGGKTSMKLYKPAGRFH
ncbi:F-box/WD repeat-containing protein 9-like isoform X2 [Corticium candelabrum]|uniref:F-box/WD repeat-containing protein 9-like isoform X2 n=1 Tax=Corticium candelabrum TaxID=121492 RepID=UPI002E2738CB|nr:F-box/WD repeat-containing protein 9-like isoform X2 [Corticium candelabrum]